MRGDMPANQSVRLTDSNAQGGDKIMGFDGPGAKSDISNKSDAGESMMK